MITMYICSRKIENIQNTFKNSVFYVFGVTFHKATV